MAAAAGLAAAAFVLRVEIRLRRHRWVFAWGDTALVLALLLVPSPAAVVATTVGKTAGAAATFLRRHPLKLVYIAASHVIAATLAAGAGLLVAGGQFQFGDARDGAALLVAGAVYDLACNALTAAVIAVADQTRPAPVWRAGLGLQTLTMTGNLAATAGALALAGLDRRLILVLPAAALVLQQAYQAIRLVRVERLSSQHLAEAITAIGQLDQDAILTQTATRAATLLCADAADVVLHPSAEGRSGPTFSAGPTQLEPAGQWWTQAVDLHEPGSEEPLGQLRVHFTAPPRVTERERSILHALAAAARNALAAAWAHADAQRLAAALSYQLTHHRVTGLPTRDPLLQRVAGHLDRARGVDLHTGATTIGLILIGLADFGGVSHVLGHEARDELLRHAGAQLRRVTGNDEAVAHLDDDQFAVFLPHVNELAELRPRADSLLAAIATRLPTDAGIVSLDAAAGIAYARDGATSPAELLRQATTALAMARRTHSPVEYYRPADDTASGPSALLLSAELADALRTEQLILYYQPVRELATGRPIAAEALVCWMHPTRGLLPGHQFLPVLEQASLLTAYLDWLLHEALTARAGWTDLDADLPVAVNLPARCLFDRGLPARISAALLAAGLRPQQLMLELTASAALGSMTTVNAVLGELDMHGIRIAIDGFGSGDASLTRLLRVPATDLKIAPDVIDAMLSSPRDRAIVRAAREIAASVDLRITATGANTARHVGAAHAAGAHAAQGDAICPPLLPSRVHAELRQLTIDSAPAMTAQVIQLRPNPNPDEAG